MGARIGIVLIAAWALSFAPGCGPVEEATAQEVSLPIIDYHVSYGPIDEVAGDVRNLIAAGWEPIGSLEPFDCGGPPAICGAQTLVRR